MAADRQRRGRGGDADVGDADVRDEGLLPDETEPVDPLGQALPDVTEARLAEAGAEPPAVGPPGRSELDEVEQEVAPTPGRGLFGRAIDFLKASWAELRRVQWPDRRQVGQGTAVVIGFVVVAGLYLGLLDAIWNPIIQAIL